MKYENLNGIDGCVIVSLELHKKVTSASSVRVSLVAGVGCSVQGSERACRVCPVHSCLDPERQRALW